MQRSKSNQRRGFTLIELLVVIGIITLLVGLLLPAIHKVREAAMRARTKSEIAELSTAIENCKSTYDVKYFPSGFILSSNYNQPAPAPIMAALSESYQYYSKIWPKAFIPGQPGMTPLPPNLPSQPGMNQNTPLNIPMDGNQTMVFFLGGMGPDFPDQDPSLLPWRPVFHCIRNGFVDSPTNPFGYQIPPAVPAAGWYSPVTGDKAKGPFFDFKPERVVNGQYLDPYGYPYILFGSKHGNDYGVFGVYAGVIPGYQLNGGWGPIGSPVSPFIGIDGKYINPNGFQIISAGRDKLFGQGGQYTPGINQYSPGGPGGDDLSNFSSGALGADSN